MLRLMMFWAFTASTFTASAFVGDAARQLEAAIYEEVARGDLDAALAQYRNLLKQATTPRPVAARALYQYGLCQNKAGRVTEAREAWNRVLREYGDQPAVVAKVRAHLAATDGPVPGPLNLRFDQGVPNQLPAAWFVPAFPGDADNWAQIRTSGCLKPHGRCAVVMAPENAPVRVSNLMQSFSARPYRGRSVRFRAFLRTEGHPLDDHAQMWLSVDRTNDQKGFFDNMSDRPIRSVEWVQAEIQARIDDDATVIKFGFMSVGRGRVWVDGVSFDTLP